MQARHWSPSTVTAAAVALMVTAGGPHVGLGVRGLWCADGRRTGRPSWVDQSVGGSGVLLQVPRARTVDEVHVLGRALGVQLGHELAPVAHRTATEDELDGPLGHGIVQRRRHESGLLQLGLIQRCRRGEIDQLIAVSYTHLTLPTIL